MLLTASKNLVFTFIFMYRSSTAHSLPYSTADIVYGSENSQSEVDDARPNSFVDSNGKEARISSCELTEQINRHSNEKLRLKKSYSAEKG